jgi:hypothetical protein
MWGTCGVHVVRPPCYRPLTTIDTHVPRANVVDQRVGVHAPTARDFEALLVGERFGVNGDQGAVDLVLPQRRHRLLLQLLNRPAGQFVRLDVLQHAGLGESVENMDAGDAGWVKALRGVGVLGCGKRVERVKEWMSGRGEAWKSGRVEEWKSGRVEE